MKTPSITLRDIEFAMRTALVAEGRNSEEINSYVAAQRMHGWLRRDTTPEIRRKAYLYFCLPPASGILPEKGLAEN